MKSLLALLMVMGLSACVTEAPPARACFHLSEAAETDIGYCQAVRSGDRLYISGIAGKGEMPEAVQSVYTRLQKTLEANGLGFQDVVKENVYTLDLDRFEASKAVRKTFYGDSLPAATWVQVQRLYSPALVLEVELIAEYPRRGAKAR